MSDPEPVTRLAMVYDADGGIIGEVRYVVMHLLGRAECALCDITHGGLKRKEEFDWMLTRLPVPAIVLHCNEQPDDLAEATFEQLPCVMGATESGWVRVLDADALRACHGEVSALEAALTEALSPA